MRHPERAHPFDRTSGHGRLFILAALIAFCMWVPVQAGAQLPSLIDLSVPLGQEVTPVYRVFGDELNSVLTGDIEQAGALALGDFNGDSFGDLLMGTPTAKDAGGTVAGGAYILYGSMGLSGTYANLFTNGIVSSAGETRILGGGIDYVAGHAVAAGDVDGDGYDDAIIGQPGVGGDNPGHVRVVFGTASGIEALNTSKKGCDLISSILWIRIGSLTGHSLGTAGALLSHHVPVSSPQTKTLTTSR